MLERNHTVSLCGDAIAAAAFMSGAIFLYEFGNYLAFLIAGYGVTVSFVGLWPMGVSVVPGGAVAAPWVKLLQVAFCITIVAASERAIRRFSLTLTKLAMVATLGMFVASLQWELLSQIALVGGAGHAALFVAIALITSGSLVGLFRDELGLADPNLRPRRPGL